MNGPKTTRVDAIDEAVVDAGFATELSPESPPWKARLEIERHRAETERLRVLVEFLTRPIHAHGGADPDPDIVTAYNLAVEAVLNGIRRAASAPMLPLVD